MEFVAGGLNGNWLRTLTDEHTSACLEVKAAIAYASSDNMYLLDACKRLRKVIAFYGRYDQGVPVHPEIIKWFLDQASPNLVCRVVPDILHAKVIWWVGAGVYIGSANMTDRAWHSNIEAGTFVPHTEIDKALKAELENFFIKTDERSHPISRQFYLHLKTLAESSRDVDKANALHKRRVPRFFPEGTGLGEDQTTGTDKDFLDFQREWNASLQFLRDIANRVTRDEYRPPWIPDDCPEGAQVDQFIHAYYYQNVRGDRGRHLVESAHQDNRLNPELALTSALKWWKQSNFNYAEEEKHLKEWAKLLQVAFQRDQVRSMERNRFIAAMSCVHAVREVARRQPSEKLGLPPGRHDQQTKIAAHLRRLYDASSKQGVGVLELLDYVVWGNGPAEFRIWRATEKDGRWHIPSIGRSTLGELLGWARPDEFPPRNNRTLKGLYALGFPIKLPNARDDGED